MRRRNQKIGIVSYSSRKEEETLINKKRSSSNHKWEGRASAKKGARRSFILPNLQYHHGFGIPTEPRRITGLDLLESLATYLRADRLSIAQALLKSVQLPEGATDAQGSWDKNYMTCRGIASYFNLLRSAMIIIIPSGRNYKPWRSGSLPGDHIKRRMWSSPRR